MLQTVLQRTFAAATVVAYASVHVAADYTPFDEAALACEQEPGRKDVHNHLDILEADVASASANNVAGVHYSQAKSQPE